MTRELNVCVTAIVRHIPSRISDFRITVLFNECRSTFSHYFADKLPSVGVANLLRVEFLALP